MKKKKPFSSTKARALWTHYGSPKKAAEKIGISESTFRKAATADLQGRDYTPSKSSQEKMRHAESRLHAKTKRKFGTQEKIFEKLDAHPNVIRAILSSSPKDREKIFQEYKHYKKYAISDKQLWQWLMASLYHRNPHWKIGQWRKRK